MNNHKLKVFSGRANPPLADKIARHLGDTLGKMRLSNFPDGEIEVRIEEDVRGRDVFVVQPTCPPVNENLMELLIILDSLRRASAGRVNVVLPYYGYARQDRKDVGRVPITAKLVANLLITAGAQRVVTLDQAPLGLRRDEPGGSVGPCGELGLGDLPSGEVGAADVADLARLHQIVERPEGLVDRRAGVRSVQVIDIDLTTRVRKKTIFGN